SKSKGNVVDPMDIVDAYGADTLRTYVMFMGDYTSATPWSEDTVKGCKRFLDRVAALTDIANAETENPEIESKVHKTIKKVSEDIESMKFNTAIAAMMTLINDFGKAGSITKSDLLNFLKLLNPFAPHLAEEMWAELGQEGFIAMAEWPAWDEEKTKDATVEIGVQVNGKVRGTIRIPADCGRDEALAAGKADANVQKFIDGKTIVKEVYVPGRILNIVVK
ncbi:MAG: class I tRNA ligase family protein, partial [Clostridium sp.]|nr:class I tRNA ligase family protein [Clostridium sp.]